ncbi:MAG: regulatory protein RecX [Gammaproteobacteria bacterium]|nr:regulatory protein RecX [Gammaproteobacteria bacterium]
MLARREHSEKELRQKLLTRGLDVEDIDVAIEQLKKEGLQSESRYTEAFVHDRVSRGYGPCRIIQELKQKGVGDEISEEYIDERDPHWIERLAEVHKRKYGDDIPQDYKEQAKQSRFLQYRGFSSDQIHRLFKRLNEYDD